MFSFRKKRLGSECRALLPSWGVLRGARFSLGLLACLLLMTSIATSVQAQDVIDREYEIKAAYLYHFGRYVIWPKDADHVKEDAVVIGVLGSDPFGPNLRRVANRKTIRGKKIIYRRFDSMEDYQPCHILFVSRTAAGDRTETAKERLAAAVKTTKGKPVLVVSDSSGFEQAGAGINLFVVENRVKMAINLDATARGELAISAQLRGLRGVVTTVRDKDKKE